MKNSYRVRQVVIHAYCNWAIGLHHNLGIVRTHVIIGILAANIEDAFYIVRHCGVLMATPIGQRPNNN
jgi:hypothetical protein